MAGSGVTFVVFELEGDPRDESSCEADHALPVRRDPLRVAPYDTRGFGVEANRTANG
jgi:hypothetical protein